MENAEMETYVGGEESMQGLSKSYRCSIPAIQFHSTGTDGRTNTSGTRSSRSCLHPQSRRRVDNCFRWRIWSLVIGRLSQSVSVRNVRLMEPLQSAIHTVVRIANYGNNVSCKQYSSEENKQLHWTQQG